MPGRLPPTWTCLRAALVGGARFTEEPTGSCQCSPVLSTGARAFARRVTDCGAISLSKQKSECASKRNECPLLQRTRAMRHPCAAERVLPSQRRCRTVPIPLAHATLSALHPRFSAAAAAHGRGRWSGHSHPPHVTGGWEDNSAASAEWGGMQASMDKDGYESTNRARRPAVVKQPPVAASPLGGSASSPARRAAGWVGGETAQEQARERSRNRTECGLWPRAAA